MGDDGSSPVINSSMAAVKREMINSDPLASAESSQPNTMLENPSSEEISADSQDTPTVDPMVTSFLKKTRWILKLNCVFYQVMSNLFI